MSEKKQTTHQLIPRQLVIFLRPRSEVWQCRFQIDGKWQRNSTNEREIDKAAKRAHELLIEANVRKRMNAVPITRYFKDIARAAIQRIDDDETHGKGKVSFKEYKVTIETYLIPFFGKYKIDSINNDVLELFNAWRIKRMGYEPKHSTILNHNAALNRVFDLAIEKGYLIKGNRPTLDAKGKESERRANFTLRETRALIANFDAWVEDARADSLSVRQLLKDYAMVLLDTGARPGKELLELTWNQVSFEMKPEAIHTGEFSDDGEGNVEEIVMIKTNKAVFLEILEHKTKKRTAAGRSDTYNAFKAIAQRNYGKTLEDMIHEGCEDRVFMFREWLNEEAIKANKVAQLRSPTSFPKLFDDYLVKTKLQIDPITNQKRVLYSLRHTYATLLLEHDSVDIHLLATQMGTSVAMIEKHYSHATVKNAIEKMRGEESKKLLQAPGYVDKRYMYTAEET